jgi:activator of 2-hydroxyglutaryl-CoA dehydratase
LAKVAIQCTADTFVVNQSLVLRINPDSFRDGENRHLRQARNRCRVLTKQKQSTMKNLILSLLLLASGSLFAQNKVYTITEQYSGMNNTSLDKIIVTDPSGVTETHDITHFLKDVVKHDSEFNKILNGVISKGYVLLNPSPNAHGDMGAGMQSVFTRTWFLSEK